MKMKFVIVTQVASSATAFTLSEESIIKRP
jgi:hypothetical protein